MKNLLPLLFFASVLFSCKNDPATGTETTDPVSADSTATPPSSDPLDAAAPEVPKKSEDGIYETISVVDSLSGKVNKKLRAVSPLSTAVSSNPQTKIDPVRPAYNAPSPKTPQQSRVVRVLTDQYWAVWALVKIGEPAANDMNKGVWFKFKEDGAYEYGQFGKIIGGGAWSFDGIQATLFLDSELLGDDREWSLKMGNSEDVMVWVGTTRFANTNVQLKLQKYAEIPKSLADMGYTK